MNNMDIVELKNEYTAVQLNLSGGGIIWSIAHHREDLSPPDIQFIDSKLNGLDSFGLSVQAAYWDQIINELNYNPTQGGDKLEHGSGVRKADYIGSNTGKSVTYHTETLALHFHPETSYVDPVTGLLAPDKWDGEPVPSDITVEQWVTLEADGVVKVKYKLTNISPQSHKPSLQQVPVFHLLKNFNAYYTQGPDGFNTGPIPSHSSPAQTEHIKTPEKWINIYDPRRNNFGLTIYSATSTEFCISNKKFVVMCQPSLLFGLDKNGGFMEHTVIIIPGTPHEGREWLVDNGYVSAKIG